MDDTNQIIEERRAKLKALRQKGIAFPNNFVREHHAGDLTAAHAATEREALAHQSVTVTVAGTGFTPTYDLDGAKDSMTQVPLAAGQIRTDVNFGYNRPPTVQDITITPKPAEELSFTGSPARRMALIGLSLLFAGAAVVLSTRSRRRAHGGTP